MVKYGMELGDWKTAEIAAQEMIAQAQGAKNIAIAHYTLGVVLYVEAVQKHKQDLIAAAHEELTKVLASAPNFPDAIFSDGQALAHMNRDEEARARLPLLPSDSQRAIPVASAPCSMPISRNWRVPAWLQRSRSPRWTASTSRWTISKAKSSLSISGQPGADPASKLCLTCGHRQEVQWRAAGRLKHQPRRR